MNPLEDKPQTSPVPREPAEQPETIQVQPSDVPTRQPQNFDDWRNRRRNDDPTS
jgi:hypothetical protein